MNGAASAKRVFRTEISDESHLIRGNGFLVLQPGLPGLPASARAIHGRGERYSQL
jgi:hypothetical protein